MIRPPIDPRDRPAPGEPTWRNILVSSALIATIPVLLWVASQPSTRLVAIVAIVGLLVAVWHLHRLVRCFHDCQGFAFDLGRTVRITITQRDGDCETTDQPCAI